jgi:hypothetical protein
MGFGLGFREVVFGLGFKDVVFGLGFKDVVFGFHFKDVIFGFHSREIIIDRKSSNKFEPDLCTRKVPILKLHKVQQLIQPRLRNIVHTRNTANRIVRQVVVDVSKSRVVLIEYRANTTHILCVW